jgi:hypothetical protein
MLLSFRPNVFKLKFLLILVDELLFSARFNALYDSSFSKFSNKLEFVVVGLAELARELNFRYEFNLLPP